MVEGVSKEKLSAGGSKASTFNPNIRQLLVMNYPFTASLARSGIGCRN